jgi:hypothetical protein
MWVMNAERTGTLVTCFPSAVLPADGIVVVDLVIREPSDSGIEGTDTSTLRGLARDSSGAPLRGSGYAIASGLFREDSITYEYTLSGGKVVIGADGKFAASVPATGDYRVQIFTGLNRPDRRDYLFEWQSDLDRDFVLQEANGPK